MGGGKHASIDVNASARQAFEARLATLAPSRLVEAVGIIGAHLHEVVEDLRPSPAEFRALLAFLTETGHHADARRQEWVLLADALGLSSAIEKIHSVRPAGATPDTVAGPFYRADAPLLAPGDDISRDGKGEPMLVTGRVTALAGAAIDAAMVEVWQANGKGRYENQEPDAQPEHNLRGKLQTDAQGRFRFLTVKPLGYCLPASGPAGTLLAQLGLPLNRPAHLNLRVSAEGFETLTTHIFDRDDPAIGEDAIFGVKPELLADFRALPNREGRIAYALDINLVLCPKGGAQPMPGRNQK
ncbi:dioxygenase [Devosia sp. YIM 151766]|uniref:dioxygenase family protein n=1 Tax=Devosia sp. YIM 151766 TaxID=3017325 RepID=UPI00255CA0DC|nr:dioxygenase [Devosia sp. YIM 151766]WIY52036.1 dioxygenase [Devosia sp. YIM 151766]